MPGAVFQSSASLFDVFAGLNVKQAGLIASFDLSNY